MRPVHERFSVGHLGDCFHDRDGWSVVHACKSPCHEDAVGYRGSLEADHPNRWVLERGHNLYLNLPDPRVPLFEREPFRAFRSFARARWSQGDQLLIHCTMGASRSPSLALLFLAKELGEISGDSYSTARREYWDLDPRYSPGRGIAEYLCENWGRL